MKEKRRKLDKSVELVSKKGVEWLVLNPVDVNQTHSIQIMNINCRNLSKSCRNQQRKSSYRCQNHPKTSRNVSIG